MGKKKKTAKKQAKKGAPPGTPPAEAPPAPCPPPVLTVESAGLGLATDETAILPGLDQLRLFLVTHSNALLSRQASVDPALARDLNSVLIYLEVKGIKDIVHDYVRIMLLIRYWRDYAAEKKTAAHRETRTEEARLDPVKRKQLADEGIKITEAQVKAAISTDPGYLQLQEIEDLWITLVAQLQNLADSMQTEILVQSSVWAQRGAGVYPQAAVPGPAPTPEM